MTSFILWYLTISLLGLLTFPLAYRLLPNLADRGYAFSRTLGWLLWGFIFWLLASLGVLRNDAGGLLFSLAVLIGLSLWALRGESAEGLQTWWRSRRGTVILVELLFLAAFAGWAFVRANNPQADGTEKPMELAFINAILRSPTFPPHDPWLSGYAISYYYFGYVLVAMLAKITATLGSVAFNLGGALVFALAAIGAYGLVYNLLSASPRGERTGDSSTWPAIAGFFGPLFVLIVSNLEGFLDLLHARGLFWSRDATGQLVSPFWQWLDLKDLNLPPPEPFRQVPDRIWWWWRASRVVQDYDYAGGVKEIIDEFPFFSFLLADLHPHVLAIPFAFLAIALALNFFLDRERSDKTPLQVRLNLRTLLWGALLAVLVGIALLVTSVSGLNLRVFALGLAGLTFGSLALLNSGSLFQQHGLDLFLRADLGERTLGGPLYIRPAYFLLAAVVLGGMAFLNIWDFPIYVALFSAAYAVKRFRETAAEDPDRSLAAGPLLKDFFFSGVAIGICGILLYLPFYLGFASQAGGPLPNLIFPTRGAHLWVMFGSLWLPVAAFLAYLLVQTRRRGESASRGYLWMGFKIIMGLALVLWVLALLFGLAITTLPEVGAFYLANLAAPGIAALFQEAFWRRITHAGGWVTLVVLLSVTVGLLLRLVSRGQRRRHTFALLLVLLGGLVVLGPEFFFLRDVFGSRMNTIFKFYYQAWLLWAIAAAYGSAVLWRSLRGGWVLAFGVGFVVVLGMSLVYPALSLPEKANKFAAPEQTLDSTAFLEPRWPNDMAAIRWLGTAPLGVVAEAVGGQYSDYARVATLSGLPNVLGWPGHEGQWRGGYTEVGSREGDIQRLYCSRDWSETQAILEQYNIRYVFVGSLERIKYQPEANTCPIGLNETKFTRFLQPVFQQGDVTVYEVPGKEILEK